MLIGLGTLIRLESLSLRQNCQQYQEPEKSQGIKGKRIVVVESHEQVLVAWADLGRELSAPPRLLTFDFHTDTRPAFIATERIRQGVR
jgi:hypothetical protein